MGLGECHSDATATDSSTENTPADTPADTSACADIRGVLVAALAIFAGSSMMLA